MKSNRQKRLSYVLEKLNLFFRKRPNTGWTEFSSLRIVPEYIEVDPETKKVIGVVRYEGNVYLTVDVDVAAGKAKVTGSLKGIKNKVKPFNERHFIEMIEDEARFLVARQ